MRKLFFILGFSLVTAMACLLITCTKDTAVVVEPPPPPNPTAANLISNPSFEDANNQPTLQDWWYCYYIPPYPITPITPNMMNNLFYYINDTTFPNSKWCLEIDGSGQQTPSAIVSIITGQNGNAIYTLTVQGKSVKRLLPIDTSFFNGTNIAIGKRQGSSTNWKHLTLDTLKSWKKYILIDTLTTLPNDTILIRLQGGGGGGPMGEWFQFDEIELTKTSP